MRGGQGGQREIRQRQLPAEGHLGFDSGEHTETHGQLHIHSNVSESIFTGGQGSLQVSSQSGQAEEAKVSGPLLFVQCSAQRVIFQEYFFGDEVTQQKGLVNNEDYFYRQYLWDYTY